jgi:hypothetical protein
VATDRTIYLCSQIDDYRLRGDELEDMNFIDYFINTYEERIRARAGSEAAGNAPEASSSNRGRPRNARILYQVDHLRSQTAHRVVRSPGHQNLPNILGPWFEQNDDPTTYGLHCASVIACLKLWCDLGALKAGYDSWTAALDDFIATANQ